MKHLAAAAVLVLVACQAGPDHDHHGHDHTSASQLAQRALSLLASLNDAQRASASLAFDGEERTNWQFVPGVYPGVTLAALDVDQKRAVHDLLHAGLSASGYHKTTMIMGLEDLLREIAEAAGRTQEAATRDPGRYSLAVFGTPDPHAAWGFRFQGHHVSWNFTSVEGHVSATPAFLGANPAEVRTGNHAGLRALPEEEDLARELLASMTPMQRLSALRETDAPADVIWGPGSLENTLGDPVGLAASDMNPQQRTRLDRLLETYLGNLDHGIAAEHRERIDRAGRDGIHFLWIGSTERGGGHYYRIHGPTFAIEYDNTQNGANHVHTLWHDLTGDFGGDLLRHHHDVHREHGHEHR